PAPDIAAVREPLASAAGRMDSAASSLGDGEERDALGAEREALSQLKLARQRLLDSQAKTDEELARRSLEAIRESLIRIRDDQINLQKKTQDPLLANGASRAARIRTRDLATQQSRLVDSLTAARSKMTGAVVFAYVCDAIVEKMRAAAEELKQG